MDILSLWLNIVLNVVKSYCASIFIFSHIIRLDLFDLFEVK